MSSNRRVSGGGMASSLLAVERILQKENSYREGITRNHASSKILAEVMAIQGDLENSMLQAATDDATKQEILASLQEQRERLKKISEKNVQNSRNVDAFIGALQGVRDQVQSTPEPAAPLDYEKIIQDKMQEFRTACAPQQLAVRDEKYCRDIRAALGERECASRGKKDDSDEELEVLRNPTGAESLKCPITAKLYEDPVRNKMCGHVYSKAGIQQMLRSRNFRCPVAGCMNRTVTMNQLEEDVETAMKVKRQRRREENERQQRMSQAVCNDSDEEVY